MTNSNKQRNLKRWSIFFVVLMISEILTPTISWALTSGPTQPEFSSFEPVATTNMVNEFTGDLTYNLPVLNIPGPDGGGYAMSLSYHSGNGVEDESSWVGYGWTLNPGSIVRNKRGYADDWNGKDVRIYNKTIPNRTVTFGGSLGDLEVYSVDLNFNGSASLRYNNYRGFGYTLGVGVSTTDGVFSLGFHLADGEGSFSYGISPGALLNKNNDDKKEADKKKRTEIHEKKEKLDFKAINQDKVDKADQASKFSGSQLLNSLGSSGYSSTVFSGIPSPQASSPFNGSSFRLNVTFQIDPTSLEISPFSASSFGSYSRQTSTEVRDPEAYGYMYSKHAWNNFNEDGNVMDYHVERASGYNRFDKVLPIPYSSIDNYSLTGEGLGGGFRMFNQKMGNYTPTESTSETVFLSGGVDLDIGLSNGAGADGSGGLQRLSVRPWGNINDGDLGLDDFSDITGIIDSEHEDEATFFRFSNDLAGNVVYGSDLNWNEPVLAEGDLTMDIENRIMHLLPGERNSRSSHIGFSFNSEIEQLTSPTGVRALAYCKDEQVHDDVNRNGPEMGDQVGEFSIVNETGSRYTYGLPVYTRNEENAMVNVEDANAGDFENNFIVYKSIPSNGSNHIAIDEDEMRVVVGQLSETPYASAYLLTSITTPDYNDRTNDGPTPDDFGGYTKFNYEKKFGDGVAGDNWYRFRSPYKGLNYQRNSFSDPKDDLAGYNSGEKEIYFLKEIETKTHKAVFVTESRHDGLEAADRTTASGTQSIPTANLDQLVRLKKIVLFKKVPGQTNGEEVQTTYFDYDYSIQSGGGLPNTNNSPGGKLTLKRVWSEYNDVYKAKIAPYKFDYEYAHLSTDNTADYSGLGESISDYAEFEDHASGIAQSANYNPLYIDAWGNYQNDASRFNEYRRWIDQSNNAVPNEDFDPAMWQLKRITLPSGGEIHVQYEQDEYAYVQHEVAHSLVSLTNGPSAIGADQSGYRLNLADVGITDPDDIAKYADQISDLYVGTDRKLFFKFFYKLQGFATPNLDDCDSDFVKGYLDVESVQVIGNEIVITPKDIDKLPQELCVDFVRTQRHGNLSTSSCNPASGQDPFNGSSAADFIWNLLEFIGDFDTSDKCLNLDASHSYLKVPVYRGVRTVEDPSNPGEYIDRIQGKRGGGLRVKRILMYDNGDSGLGRNLYGTEYGYVTKDFEGNFISSGVATNEPTIIREENPMITLMERFRQSWGNKMLAGKDKKQMEGPLGEELLPPPSVGYSRIVAKGIHEGKTHQGHTVKEFYTAYDCPFYYSENLADPIDPMWSQNKGENMASAIDDEGSSPFPVSLPAGIINISHNHAKVRQGFNFVVNKMHGQVKGSATYSNLYKPDNSNLTTSLMDQENQETLIAKEVHNYFAPGENMFVMTSPNHYVSRSVGVEQDVAFETKHIRDLTETLAIEGDAGAGIFGLAIIPFGQAAPSLTYVNNEIYSHTSTKITNFPAIEKSMSSYVDGIWHHTVNMAFDDRTGKPVVTTTYDDFRSGTTLTLQDTDHNSAITSYNYTAPMVYDEMGPKYLTEGLIINGTFPYVYESNQIDLGPIADPVLLCELAETMIPGSLIQLIDPDGDEPNLENLFHIDNLENEILHLLPVSYSSYSDELPTQVQINIIRTGNTNQLDVPIGNVSVYGDISSETIQATVSESNAMSALASALTGIQGGGSPPIPGSTVQSLTNSMDLFVDGSCQTFPSNYGIEITNEGLLNIIETIVDPGPANLECSEISPELSLYLQEYREKYLMEVFNPDFKRIKCYDTKFAIDDDKWFIDVAEMWPAELESAANTIFANNISGVIDDLPCSIPISDYFEALFFRPHPILTKVDANDNVTYHNGQIVIHDIVLDKYVVVTVKCITKNNEDYLYLYYGTTDADGLDANGDGIAGDIDYTQLEEVLFHPDIWVGKFFANGDDVCLGYDHDDVNTANNIITPLNNVNTVNFVCGDQDSETIIHCSTEFGYQPGGSFGIDNSQSDYNLVYYPFGPGCNTTFNLVSCLTFCDFSNHVMNNVLTSNFSTFDDHWEYDYQAYVTSDFDLNDFNNLNAFETGERGKWRSSGSYAYMTDRGMVAQSEANNDEERNYNTGVYDMLLFDWINPDTYTQFKKVNTVTRYSPNGNAIEERNIIDVFSVAKYGYENTMPYLVGNNTDYASVMAEGFENLYDGTFLEDGFELSSYAGNIITNDAHSGASCLQLLPTNSGLKLTEINPGSDLDEQGGLIKFWLKSDRVDRENIAQEMKCLLVDPANPDDPLSYSTTEIARSGDWGLYETKFPSGLAEDTEVFLKYDFAFPQEMLFIDDLRLQPTRSSLTTYVYDKNTLRLTASFDDQNFGLFYQYNDEGQLVRKLKETTRGVKTIQETQYNIPEIDSP